MSITSKLPYRVPPASVYNLVRLMTVVMLINEQSIDHEVRTTSCFGAAATNITSNNKRVKEASPLDDPSPEIAQLSWAAPNTTSYGYLGDHVMLEDLSRISTSRVPSQLELDVNASLFEPKRLIDYSIQVATTRADKNLSTELFSRRTAPLDVLPVDSTEPNTSGTERLRSRRGHKQLGAPVLHKHQALVTAQNLDPLHLSAAESKKIEQNGECALILKRTYILKKHSEDEWGDKFVFNDADPDEKKKKKVHKTDLCIKYADINKAVEEAKHKLKFKKPEDLDDSFELSEQSIGALAELNLATAQLITKKFDLSHDEILNALPMIDMTSTKFSWLGLCPKHVKPMFCSKSRYRTITAHCNNLRHPSWGATNTPYSRYLPPDYADGLTLPRAAQDGSPLPSARLITSIVHRDQDEPSNDYSALFASWGQVLNHDVTRAAVGEGTYGLPYQLSGLSPPLSLSFSN